MERKEEIIQASEEFGFWKAGEAIFTLGAEWADEHPRRGLVDINKVCKFLDDYSFIPTYVINELKNEFSK